jgi:hypothetical protein
VYAGLFALPASAGRPELRGTRVIELLETLQRDGMNLVFSTAVVPPGLMIPIEPQAEAPRELLDEVLAAVGLAVLPGPEGTLLVVEQPVQSGSLGGSVVSAELRSPIGGAVVRVRGRDASAVTAPDGRFEIRDVPPGLHTLEIEAAGRRPLVTGPLRVRAGSTASIDVALEALLSHVEHVVVTPGLHRLLREEQEAARLLSGDDSVLMPTFGGDVSRVVELLPGVAAADNSAAFNVRGTEAQDVSFVLDGLELYAPYHLQSFQSPFSSIDSEVVDRIEFLGGGFTADRGDRHGGFVDLATAYPMEAGRTAIELGSLNSRVTHAHAASHGSLLVSARAWYPEAVRDSIELGETGLDPRFQDLYAKYSFHAGPRAIVSLHTLLAHDQMEFVEQGGGERVDADNDSIYLWARAVGSLGRHVISETLLSVGRLDRSRVGLSEPEDEIVSVDDQRRVGFAGLEQHFTWRASQKGLARFGAHVRPLDARYRYFAEDPNRTTAHVLDPEGTSFAAYASYRAAIGPRLVVEGGLRWDRQNYTDDEQLGPRLNAVLELGARSHLRASLGRFYQSQRIHELRVEDGQTSFLPAELSRQVELSFEHAFARGLRLRLDAYDHSLSDLHPRSENAFNPLELFPETEQDRVTVEPDAARLRGAEVLLSGPAEASFYWWVSYTRSSAEDEIRGADVPRSWDQPHAGRAFIAYRFGERGSLALSGTAHSGWPTTPITAGIDPESGEPEAELGPRNSTRFDDYARLDFKGRWSFALPRGRLTAELEVLNLTDRQNPCCVDDVEFEELPGGGFAAQPLYVPWLGRTPSFSLSWEF